MSFGDKFFLFNKLKQQINPATEEKQDLQIANVGSPEDLPSAGDGTLIAIAKRIRDIFQDVWNETLHFLNIGVFNVAGEQIDPATSQLQQSILDYLNTNTRDVFGNNLSETRHNWMEVPFDDQSFEQFAEVDRTGGGDANQVLGETKMVTGADPTSYVFVHCTDDVRYRASKEIGAGFTFKFTGAVTDTSTQRIGACFGSTPIPQTCWNNSVHFGFEGSAFGLHYRRGGALIDSVDKAAIDSIMGYQVDFTKNQIALMLFGLFGHRGCVVVLFSQTERVFKKIADFSVVNTENVPFFQTNLRMHVIAELRKTNGAEILQIDSTCWSGWTTAGAKRLSDPFTPRTLVTPTESVITAEIATALGSFVQLRARSPNDNNANPGFGLETLGYNLIFDPGGNPANRWDRARGITGIARGIQEPQLLDYPNSTLGSVGATSAQALPALSTRRAVVVTVKVPGGQGAGIHLHFGNGNATTSDYYLASGDKETFYTNQRIAVIRSGGLVSVKYHMIRAVPTE